MSSINPKKDARRPYEGPVDEDLRAALKEQFSRFDKQGKGYLDGAEFHRILCGDSGAGLTDLQYAEVMEIVDKRGDGRIQLEEYINWLCRSAADRARRTRFKDSDVGDSSAFVGGEDNKMLRFVDGVVMNAVNVGTEAIKAGAYYTVHRFDGSHAKFQRCSVVMEHQGPDILSC